MASRLICGAKKRLVTYLPDFKCAIKHVKAFSSMQSKIKTQTHGLSFGPDGDPVLWPDMALGPFADSPQFPLPGFTGVNLEELGVNPQEARARLIPLTGPEGLTIMRTVLQGGLHGLSIGHRGDKLPSTLEMEKLHRAQQHMMEKYISQLEERFEKEDDLYDSEYEGYDMSSTSLPKFECEVHDCPNQRYEIVNANFVDLFPGKNLQEGPFTAVTITLKTENDMSAYNEDVEEEREELLDQFHDLAQVMCEALKGKGYWADFIDPSSGRPYYGDFTNATLFETDERYKHFGFDIDDAGCCKVISHPLWGTRVFVGCLFTNAPSDDPIHKSMLMELKTLEEKEPVMAPDEPPAKT
ncbi:methylmalonic aciduria and homocystinuria type D protein, mitochondrial [Lingula anatina]|uniref:Methylmalonic aciduria and homocystinuria type D protein, mitochondrial n=1 Tax=Lingula anatina TaxID=7574 RepID=A0A1S3IFC3_LINAN|nr:methylmalonic aciduria and homocystinuria type D protein, mitochondrial [Lingula anatina]|eukprot:XP_013396843.1 methylmalonic aciduria and homocystinuria type D protein, mitochondrial [Lingula anatina]